MIKKSDVWCTDTDVKLTGLILTAYKNKQTCLDKFVKMYLYFFMIIVYNKYTI